MEKIKSLINGSFKLKNELIRFKYMPYDFKIAKQCWHELLKLEIGCEPIYNEVNKQTYENMIKYAHGDESCVWDLKRSLLLAGNTGSGKSVVMEVLKKYLSIDNVKYCNNGKTLHFDYHIFNAKEITDNVTSKGIGSLEKYFIYQNILIDDLGAERNDVKHFGNSINCIEEIIEARYRKNMFTHITTNLPMTGEKSIESKYGDRVYSRINQMCNYIEFVGTDFRLR